MNEQLQAQAEKLRSSNVFGREGPSTRLFEFLLERSLAGVAPKEIEIAMRVFGKGPDFPVAQDASVRVYVHKLRRRLDEYYAGAGRAERHRIVVPKGEYRLVLEEVAVPEPAVEPSGLEQAPPPRRSTGGKALWLAIVLAVSLLANVALVLHRQEISKGGDAEYAEVRNNPLWSTLLADDAPINVVIGDYFIFGERGLDGNVQRLIREFNINSSSDLHEQLYRHPELKQQYENLELRYLPVASAHVLGEVMSILSSSKKRVRITLASDVNGHTLKSGHIVYIGFLSGMGMLQDLAFQNSRFSVGGSYDEIVDGADHRTYVSQAGEPLQGGRLYRDYGYLSSFVAPSGKQIVVIAGTRDVALMHMAEVLTNKTQLNALSQAATGPTLEALYEVTGIDSTDVNGRLLATAPVDVNAREPMALGPAPLPSSIAPGAADAFSSVRAGSLSDALQR